MLLPGLDGSRVLFEPLIEQLVVRTTPVDYPSTGANGYRDLLPRVLDRLPAGPDFALLGWSFSGPLALMAAATKPAGLRAVILCASFIRKPVRLAPASLGRLVRPLFLRKFGRLAVAKTLLAGYASPELSKLLTRAHEQAHAKALAQRIRATLSVDVEAELTACPVPVLYLGAQHDRVVRPHNARRIREARPDTEIAYLPGPHLNLATNPTDNARVIEEFLGRLA